MCGIAGVINHPEAANLTYLMLYALQHRGKESAGIVSSDGERLYVERDRGLVADVFNEERLGKLPGRQAIGHVRYSTAGGNLACNMQPLVPEETWREPFAIAHNGNLPLAMRQRDELKRTGAVFNTRTDTEIIAHLLARDRNPDFTQALVSIFGSFQGAYALLVQTPKAIYAIRDPNGFRPLCFGKLDGAFVFASESCAFDLIGAEYLREVGAGEICKFGPAGHEMDFGIGPAEQVSTPCVFEHVYFARPDSVVFGKSVSQSRYAMGRELARQCPASADLVVPVPDSGMWAGLGYSYESEIPLGYGLTRNHYIGRTFIEPKDAIRHFGVKVKLNPDRSVLKGKRVVLVDDSIVRGITSGKIVKMVRDAEAAEVHVRISSPPFLSRCYYGIDTPTDGELIASSMSVEETRERIGADSLGYLSLGGMKHAVSRAGKSFCDACFTRDYPIPVT